MSYPSPPAPPIWPAPPIPPRPQARWIAPVSLAVALVAIAVAAFAVVRSIPEEAPPATSQQVATAKASVCGAYTTVSKAVFLQTHADLGQEPAALAAVAANARMAMSDGATYLLAHVEPATSPELAEAANDFAGDLQKIAIHALAGAANGDPAQAARLSDAEKAGNKIAVLCK